MHADLSLAFNDCRLSLEGVPSTVALLSMRMIYGRARTS